MATNLNNIKNKSSGFKQPILSAGAYPARIVQIIDLGLQPQPDYLGEAKEPAYEIDITYELLDEFCVSEDGTVNEDLPRWVSERIPLKSLKAEKAKSTLRYLVLDPKMEFKGEFLSLVGKPCMVNIVENPGKGKNAGKVFNNVSGISQMRDKEATKAPELKNPAVTFSLDTPDINVFNKMPSWLQDKVKANLEFNGSKLQKLLGGTPPKDEHGVDKDDNTPDTDTEKSEW